MNKAKKEKKPETDTEQRQKVPIKKTSKITVEALISRNKLI